MKNHADKGPAFHLDNEKNKTQEICIQDEYKC